MNRIQTQAQKLWQVLSAPETGKSYQQAWTTTVSVIKETGLLLWLVICLVLVFSEWFWKFSIKSGSDFREWFNTMERPSPERIASESGRTIVSAGKDAFTKAVGQAREQLGLSTAPPASPAATAKPQPPKPEAPKAETPVVNSPVAQPVTPSEPPTA